MRYSFSKRIISAFLCVALVMTYLPLSSMAASISNISREADASTMNSYTKYFPTTDGISTENAGGVWMDKSVFTDASEFAGLGISKDKEDSFLVALSSMAANMSITGTSGVPTDSMLILDVSGSMNDNQGNNDVAEELVEAANESIKTLLSANKNSRVGVVLYSGSSSSSTNYTTAATLLLPLGRYTTGADSRYLTYTVTGRNDTTETVGIDNDVVYEGTTQKPTSRSKEVVGATYIQRGIITAMNEFVDNGNTINTSDKRKPVVVLMSDGAPSLGSTNFTDPGRNQNGGYNLGSGSGTSAALGFVSQLTAAYAKAKIEEKYKTDALFYTLGLGLGANDTVALSVMDPDNEDGSTAVDDFWNDIQRNWFDQITFEGYNHIDVGETVSLGNGRYVTKIDTPLEQNYVDRYFAASTTNLVQVFQNIMSAIQLQSGYYPTLIAESEDLSGYVSFVDRIGEYMSVTDIKGILIHDHLFSGADLASNFVTGGGNLGTWENPTALGIEMVAAVRARLGLDSDDTARTLIGLAYENGQLSYTNVNNYSNYIGWYANAKGEYLGFYNEGTTSLPAATGNAATDPAFVIRSYGYLGEVDESHGVSESDMMYATVQVRKNIATGDEIVTFAVPAALIPIITYEVTLDENGDLSELTFSGANKPIRLVYEVALDEGINSFNVKEMVSAEYLSDPHNINADGSVNFYTNQWEHQNVTGYGTVNTYGYFNPSRQNDKYYYLQDTPVYSDASGTLYKGSAKPDADTTFYRSYKVYKNNGSLSTEIVYRALSDAAKATAQQKADGSWYIPKGNVHVNLDGYTIDKNQNKTATLGQTYVPFVDTKYHEVNEEGYDFYVGATLGNNGKLTLASETGIKLSKAMASGVAAPDDAFTFNIFNTTNNSDNSTYPAWLVSADGTKADISVEMNGGHAAINLKAGDTLYIGNMTAGDTFRIVERETAEYLATVTGLSDADTVTINQNEIKAVSFVNDKRGAGNLTIAKEVEHDFGQDYQIPADKTFTMQVTLSGIGTANAVFTAEHSGNSAIKNITTDANGKFTVTLKHDEQLEVFGLPAGTIATVVETEKGNGFTPAYWDNGVLGDGEVTVVDNNTVSVIVVNDYAPAEVYPVYVTVGGSKTLSGRDWLATDSFTFELQRFDGVDANTEKEIWTKISDATANSANRSFNFTTAFANERYTKAGTYYYRAIEIEPSASIGGISYDKTVHSFSVIVGDADMDGQLEITGVVASRPDTTEVTATADGWNVNAEFTNRYSTSGNATVTIDLNKAIANNGGAEKSLAGYSFGLYDGENLVYTSPKTTDRGFARFVLSYTATGTYKYTLKEIAPLTVPDGWTYSTVEIPVTVVVSDDGDGTISAIIYNGDSQPANAGASIAATFTNTYDPADTELAIDFVSKEISGRDLNDNEFTFEVQNQDGSKVLEGTNNKAGKVTFDGKLEFDKVGTYFYNIVETGADGNGVVTDKTTYRVTVTVTDTNGQLSASYVLVNATGNAITFKNSYTATSVTHSIKGTKELRGRTLVNDEFSFVLTEQSYNGSAIQNPKSWTVKNFAAGTNNIVFPTITYDKAGTYVYTVKENLPDGGTAYGISYDSRSYTVTVVIEDNKEGALIVKSETVGGAGTTLKFENNYEANPTTAQITGEKQLTGRVDNNLVGGEYEFELYNSNADWEKLGNAKETVENGAGGLIAFTNIDFTTAGKQYFIVVEKAPDGAVGRVYNGVTYDDTEYRVLVEVTDDLKGQLHATIHVYDDEGIPQDKIQFVNVYKITDGANVTLSGEKTISGREFKSGDSFSFELYEADENYSIGQTPKKTAAMDLTTHKYEFSIDFTAADAGKTFYYVVKEADAGKKLNGLTYSSGQYQIRVEVKDNGVGGIETVTTVVNATTATLNFVNEYAIEEGTSVKFEGRKSLENKDLGELKFNFNLIESDASWKLGKTLQTKQNSGAVFAFDEISYTAAGDYYYLIAEEDAGKSANGITNDSAVYRIYVKVIDNLDGTLSKAVTMTKVNGAALENATEIKFTNVYTVTGSDSIQLSGVKTLDGREWSTSDKFVFELYAADKNFNNLGATAEATATADAANGRFVIDMTYQPDDMGKTFYYVLKEKNAGKTIDGVTYSKTEYKVTVTVTDGGNGAVEANATVADGAINALNFTNDYNPASATIDFVGNKKLNLISGTRALKENDFTFDLYRANASFEIDGAAIGSVKNDANGRFAFIDVALDAAGTHNFIIKENSQNPIGGVIYDNTQYHITVTAEDNGKGKLVVTTSTMKKVKDNSSESADDIIFINDYSVTATNATVGGGKELHGRELANGEFKFLMIEADEQFNAIDGATAMTALNNEKGDFSFDALSFTEAGKYYFVVYEDDTVAAERVTFDGTVYYVTIEVTDDENGKLVAGEPKIVKKGSADDVSEITFTNIYTPKPDDITIDIDVVKTVVNKGSDKIGPEGFEFLLKALADGAEGITAQSDAKGKAKFTLSYTEDDIGKSFSYKLTEVNSGKANVSYSTAEHTITVAISLNQNNELVAEITQNGEKAGEVVAEFENLYDYTPDPDLPDSPETGDNNSLHIWFALLFISGGGIIGTALYGKKRREQAN